MRRREDGCHFPAVIFACVFGALLPATRAAAQCTPVTAQAPQAGEPVMCLCRIGPVATEAPVCEIKTQNFEDGRVDYIDWVNENGISYHIIVITPKLWQGFKGYLSRWRHNHKCVATELQIGNPSRFEGSAGRVDIPPQVTWTGVCAAAASSYTARAIAVGHQVVELHADVRFNDRRAGQTFSALIARVQVFRPPSR
jgi:hypothetical protein